MFINANNAVTLKQMEKKNESIAALEYVKLQPLGRRAQNANTYTRTVA